MGWVFPNCLWVSFVLLLQIQICFGCLEEERIALLEFKAYVNWTDSEYGYGLPSWVDDRESDCCGWERLLCNQTTGRVIHLSLDDIRGDSSSIWYLNVTLLSAFEDLQHLNLSSNWLDGCLNNEGFERLP
ncbi:receptor-like protein 14 [Telopea speciosissima]|uniref:receptor-like protein 14 n=1 Tax=Telopea speciosissima TaxID=54955 RepID=UPI001CC6D6BB|nr:receptor-like protein 14 [Telopea speciosissima]